MFGCVRYHRNRAHRGLVRRPAVGTVNAATTTTDDDTDDATDNTAALDTKKWNLTITPAFVAVTGAKVGGKLGTPKSLSGGRTANRTASRTFFGSMRLPRRRMRVNCGNPIHMKSNERELRYYNSSPKHLKDGSETHQERERVLLSLSYVYGARKDTRALLALSRLKNDVPLSQLQWQDASLRNAPGDIVIARDLLAYKESNGAFITKAIRPFVAKK